MAESASNPSTPDAPAAIRPVPEDGYVDFFGYGSAAEGWLFCGWARIASSRLPDRVQVIAQFRHGRLSAKALTCWHSRPDLGGRGTGMVVYFPASNRSLGEFVGLEMALPGFSRRLQVPSVRPLEHLHEVDLVTRLRGMLQSATDDRPRRKLLGLLSRQPFSGVDTLEQLPAPVMFEADETVLVPPNGLLVLGWMLDPTDAVASIRIRSGMLSSRPIDQRWLRVSRPDVVDAVASRYGITDARCGFVAYAPNCVDRGEQLYVEVELHEGEVGYKPLPRPVRRGVSAMRRVLESVHLTSDEIEPAFNKVLGPSLVAINEARLKQPRPRSEIVYGEPNPNPDCSIIVPLYGRIDFMMYQLALMSEADMSRHEFIYVLDDPPRKHELLALAQSTWQRFGIPFRVVAMQENLGFAPANNVGLEYARGEYLCYLNSDVMPNEPRWLDLILQNLRDDPTIGIASALLLFEDGTVQHEGITYERLPELGNWPFPVHPNKGRFPDPWAELATVEAVTGACMVLRTELARELGGFDEVYAIGDFEDSDLCFKVKQRGLRCIVDRRVRMWHLERQSQATASQSWRMYLTLLNAWTHARRWFPPSTAPGAPRSSANAAPASAAGCT